MTEEQKLAIRCAYDDLIGVVQCLVEGRGTPDGIDTGAIELTMGEMEAAFPDIIEPYIPGSLVNVCN